jgi:transcription initiation factor TFIIH subunit 1
MTLPDVIPPSILLQMTTCATAANEFLRQFWTAIYPPVTELPTLANSTPAQKVARLTKMATYLSRTNEKVEAIIDSAREEGVDPQVMQAVSSPLSSYGILCMTMCLQAFAPLLASVDRALETYKTRKR